VAGLALAVASHSGCAALTPNHASVVRRARPTLCCAVLCSSVCTRARTERFKRASSACGTVSVCARSILFTTVAAYHDALARVSYKCDKLSAGRRVTRQARRACGRVLTRHTDCFLSQGLPKIPTVSIDFCRSIYPEKTCCLPVHVRHRFVPVDPNTRTFCAHALSSRAPRMRTSRTYT
jgi:hypothetical protein